MASKFGGIPITNEDIGMLSLPDKTQIGPAKDKFDSPAIQTLLANKNKNFVDRILNPDNYPKRNNPDGSYSTHLMSSSEVDGKNIVYPTLVYNKEKNSLFSPEDPVKYALENGEYIPFDTPESADKFASGDYKLGLNYYQGGVKPSVDVNSTPQSKFGGIPAIAGQPGTPSEEPTIKVAAPQFEPIEVSGSKFGGIPVNDAAEKEWLGTGGIKEAAKAVPARAGIGGLAGFQDLSGTGGWGLVDMLSGDLQRGWRKLNTKAKNIYWDARDAFGIKRPEIPPELQGDQLRPYNPGIVDNALGGLNEFASGAAEESQKMTDALREKSAEFGGGKIGEGAETVGNLAGGTLPMLAFSPAGLPAAAIGGGAMQAGLGYEQYKDKIGEQKASNLGKLQGIATIVSTLVGGKTGPEAAMELTASKGLKNALKNYFKESIGEGFEEASEQVMQDLAANAEGGENYSGEDLLKNALFAWAAGAGMGAGFRGLADISNAIENRRGNSKTASAITPANQPVIESSAGEQQQLATQPVVQQNTEESQVAPAPEVGMDTKEVTELDRREHPGLSDEEILNWKQGQQFAEDAYAATENGNQTPIDSNVNLKEDETVSGQTNEQGAPAVDMAAPVEQRENTGGNSAESSVQLGSDQAGLGTSVGGEASSQIESSGPASQPIESVTRPKNFTLPYAPLGAPDVLDFINENGGMMPRENARQRAEQRGESIGAEYDGYDPGNIRGVYRHAIFGGNTPVDVMAQQAFEAGHISEPTPDALWQTVGQSITARQNNRAAEMAETKAARKADRQDKSFQKDITKPNKKGTTAVSAETLRVGDVIKLGDENLRVTNIDPDDYSVTLEDGEKYGVQQVADGQVLYVQQVKSKSPSASTAKAPKSARGKLLQKAVKEVFKGAKNAPEVVVVDTVDQLPNDSNGNAARQMESGTIEGYYNTDGKVYLIASNLQTTRRAVEVVMHETAGHYGLRGLLGFNSPAYNTTMDNVFKSVVGNPSSEPKNGSRYKKLDQRITERSGYTTIEELAQDYGFDLDTVDGQRKLAEELLSRYAEFLPIQRSGMPTWFRRALTAIRNAINRVMRGRVEFSDADILNLLRASNRYVREGAPSTGLTGDARFSKRGTNENQGSENIPETGVQREEGSGGNRGELGRGRNNRSGERQENDLRGTGGAVAPKHFLGQYLEKEAGTSLEFGDGVLGQEYALYNLANENNQLIPKQRIDELKQNEYPGGMEHRIFLDPKNSRIYKLTRPGNWGVMGNPVDYLKSIAAFSQVAPELNIKVEGVYLNDDAPTILTSYNQIEGEHPHLAELKRYLKSKGWQQSGEAKYNTYVHKSGLELLDAHPGNFIKSAAGKIYPIDVHFDSTDADRILGNNSSGLLFSKRKNDRHYVEPGFYSQLEEGISEKMPAKASSEQVLNIAKSIAKPEELKWSGLEEFLQGKKSLTRDEVLQYLQNEGSIQFFELTGSNNHAGKLDDLLNALPRQELMSVATEAGMDRVSVANLAPQLEDGRLKLDQLPESVRPIASKYLDAFEHLSNIKGNDFEPSYGAYTLPGGENYREVVLAHNDKPSKELSAWRDKLMAVGKQYDPNSQEYNSIWAQRPKELGARYESRHFKGINNYVAHMRLTDRTDAGGKNGLFIEEIQSDRHQAAREKGYIDDVRKSRMLELGNREREISDRLVELRRLGQIDNQEWKSLQSESQQVSEQIQNLNTQGGIVGVSDAPFRKDWSLQMFKRALREAVETGKSWIGWTNGDTQANRFDLSNQVDSIQWGKAQDGFWIQPIKDNRAVNSATKSGLTAEQLTDYVGKDAANKILEASKSRNDGELTGNDLKVGGAGMKGFYDNILPKEIGKYVKKWGAKVERSTVPTIGGRYELYDPEGNFYDAFPTEERAQYAAGVSGIGFTVKPAKTSTPIWKVDITPDMQKSVKDGQPLFSKRKNQPGQEDEIKTGAAAGRSYLDEGEMQPSPEINRLNREVQETARRVAELEGNGLKQEQAALELEQKQGELRQAVQKYVENNPQKQQIEQRMAELQNFLSSPQTLNEQAEKIARDELGQLHNDLAGVMAQLEQQANLLTGGLDAEENPSLPAVSETLDAEEAFLYGPQVPSLWRPVGWSRFYKGAADVLLGTKGMEFLGHAVRKHVDRARYYQGKVTAPFRAWTKQYSSRDQKQAFKEFEEYFRKVDAPIIEETATGEFKRGARDHERMLPIDGYSKAGQALIGLWQDQALYMQGLNKKNRLVVWDDKNKTFRPIGTIANYFPRTLKPEIRALLQDPTSDPKRWRVIVDELIKKQYVKNSIEAAKFLNDQFKSESAFDYFNNIEAARQVQLPTLLYDYSFDAARRYIMSWCERAAQIEAYGQKVGKQGKDLFDIAQEKTIHGPTKEYIEAVRQRAYAVSPKSVWARAMTVLNSLATGTQLSNPITVFTNLTSGLAYNATTVGFIPAIKGAWELRSLARSAQAIAEAGEHGIILDDLMNLTQDIEEISSSEPQGTLQKIVQPAVKPSQWLAEKGLKWSGFNASETFVRAHGYLTARAFLREALKCWGGDVAQSRRGRLYEAWLERNGFDVDALRLENGSGPETGRFLRGAVNLAQGGYRFDQVPVFMDTPTGRFLFKYQKWGSQMAANFVRNALAPAWGYEVTGWKKIGNIDAIPILKTATDRNGNARPRDFAPLIGYLLVTAALGAGLDDLYALIFGRAQRGSSWHEIGAKMDEDALKGLEMAVGKIIQQQLVCGAYGSFGNYGQMMQDFASRSKFKSPLDPPGLATLKTGQEILMRLVEQGTLTKSDLDDILRGQVRMYATGKAALARALSVVGAEQQWQENELARQDVSWLNSVTRRYADEIGVANRRMDFSRIGKTEQSRYYDEVNRALLRGDLAGTRDAVNIYLAQFKDEEARSMALRSLSASVLSRRPIKVGSAGAEREQMFMAWAQRNLSPEDLTRVQDIDSRYKETAIQAGLMKPSGTRQLSPQQLKESQRRMLWRNRTSYNTLPEKPESLDAQLRLVTDGRKPAVLVPKGTPDTLRQNALAAGLREATTVAGTFYYDPEQVTRMELRHAAAQDRIGDVLGYGISGKPTPDQTIGTVTVRNQQGAEKFSVLTDRDNLPSVAKAAAKITDEGDQVALERPEETLRRRIA
jgi:hypothetical protein